MRRISNFEKPIKKVLFLGYDEKKTEIINSLIDHGCNVDHSSEEVSAMHGYDFVVSFGYRHILTKKCIDAFNCPIFNLHIAYLPFNRGAHPNFWSFFDGTPSGVSIHLIDKGIDTGPILFQKKINFVNEKTFVETYKRLFIEIEDLFVKNIELIIQKNWSVKNQVGKGTFHSLKDLPKDFSGWESVIEDEIKRLKQKSIH